VFHLGLYLVVGVWCFVRGFCGCELCV
jgi:hypothetical protein